MKKIITLVLALAMAVSLFTGCGKKNNAETVSYTHLRAHET